MNSFQERFSQHHSQVFTVDTVLHQARTRFQDVLVFENRLFGCYSACNIDPLSRGIGVQN